MATWAELNTSRAVKLFKRGLSIPDIAERFGDRKQQNKVRAALFTAGVYKYRRGSKAKRTR